MPSSRLRPLRARSGGRTRPGRVGTWSGGATAAACRSSSPRWRRRRQTSSPPGAAPRCKYDRQLDAYWDEIEKKRAGRRAKRGSTKFFDTEDYVWSFPPTFQGPRLSADLDQRWARFLAAGPAGPAGRGKEGAAGPRRLPRRSAQALWLRAEAHPRARVQAPLRGGGDLAGPHQGAGGPRLRARDGRRRHGRHAGRHQPHHQEGQADLLGARLRAAAARQHHRRAGQARRPVRQTPATPQGQRQRSGAHRRAAPQDRLAAAHDPQRQVGARRLVPPRRLRADVERLRHSRHQSRRRHRALAAVAEAARASRTPPPARA